MARSDASSMRRAWPSVCSYDGGMSDLRSTRTSATYSTIILSGMPVLRPSLTRTRALLVVLAIVSLVALFTTRVSSKMPDFQVYWTAGARALAAEPLYRTDDGHYQFKYL